MATNFGKLNFSTSFNPTSAFPLDARSYFESYEEAVAAAQTAEAAGSSNTVYYIGQILVVNEAGSVSAYQINADKTLVKLAATTSSGDLSADVVELQGKVGALETTVGTAESGLVKDVADLETLTGTLSTTLSTLSTNLGTLSSTVSTISGKVTTIEGTLSTVSSTISALDGRLGTAEGEIDALQAQIGGLTGAMHFIGTSTTDPAEGATVSGHDEFEAGDVCLFEGKEYVYDGADWQELGDEGSHLTKTEASATYVTKSTTINGHSLSANITLSSADIADLSQTISAATTPIISSVSALDTRVEALETDKVTEEDITNAIGALDVATISVGAGETIKSIGEVDGKIVVEKQAITISQGAVTGLPAALAEKQTLSQVQATISTAISALDLENTYLKTVPQATAEALGGIKLGHTEGENEYAVVLDDEGKAYVTVSIPEAVTYSAGAGLTLSGTTFLIGNGAITNAMLAGSIANEKITSLDVQKLTQSNDDTLILDGGDAQ